MWVSKLSVRLPQSLSGYTEDKADVVVEFDPSCEALIFSSDGVPQHGMSSTLSLLYKEVRTSTEV